MLRRHFLVTVCVVLSATFGVLGLAACGGGGGGGGGGSQQRASNSQVTITPARGSSSQTSLPTEPSRRSAPQASGNNLSGLEVAGAGTTQSLLALNRSSRTIRFSAGRWFEPRDGSLQRMMVTRTTSIPPGRLVTIPAACMQQEKRVPGNGARFFSSSKPVTGQVQQCQANCLSSGQAVQSCVWGCQPSNTQGGQVTVSVRDACNDGYRINYRYYSFDSSGNRVGVWPSNTRIYHTTHYDRVVTHNLRCQSGVANICIGAEQGNAYWGVGIDGDRRGCTNCCYSCPSSGNRTYSTYGFACQR